MTYYCPNIGVNVGLENSYVAVARTHSVARTTVRGGDIC